MWIDRTTAIRSECLANFGSGLPLGSERIWGGEHLGMTLDEREVLGIQKMLRAGLAIPIEKLRFWVKQIMMWRTARHMQINHSLGPRCKVRAGEVECGRT